MALGRARSGKKSYKSCILRAGSGYWETMLLERTPEIAQAAGLIAAQADSTIDVALTKLVTRAWLTDQTLQLAAIEVLERRERCSPPLIGAAPKSSGWGIAVDRDAEEDHG